MKIAYFDSRARPYSGRLNWTDLVITRSGFCWVDRDDVLLALASSGDDRYIVERRLLVTNAEEGGDSLDVYCEPRDLIGATTIERGDPRLAGWWPEPRAYAVQVPDVVADAMGWRFAL